MNDIFNTNKENSNRVLLNLYAHHSLNRDRIILIDFISLYAKDFGISDFNLNGDGPYNLTEYGTKKLQITESIKFLVRQNYIDVDIINNHFIYTINDRGLKYCNTLKSDYAADYIEQVHIVSSYFVDFTDAEILKFIEKTAVSLLR
ncbi:ABC-three component system middle component 2 [Facklamia languida]